MQILIKVVVTAIAAGLAYLLAGAAGQPRIWQLTMSVFVGGVVLVVQFLIESVANTSRLSAEVDVVSQTATHLAGADEHLDSSDLTRLVMAVGRIDRRKDLQIQFANHQIKALVELVNGFVSGRADHEGEDPDWLLGLTDTATMSIDATSMTSFDRAGRFVDEGGFWSSDLGLRYLGRQRRAIERDVRIRRLFLLSEKPAEPAQIKALLDPHEKIGVETRILRFSEIPFLHQQSLDDFILFDRQISYEFHTTPALSEDVTPLIASVALVSDARFVKRRHERFEDLWAAADPAGDRPR
ncbi:hypothetical protein [Actinoplanes sp. NPDC026619]|uniref:hypothetical protein n=1 Tax=Actinoplanes sp. NPDC026619 TaxID=3155798 RepID=UPI0033EB6031